MATIATITNRLTILCAVGAEDAEKDANAIRLPTCMMCRSNKRCDDLKKALERGEYSNGNHRIEITPSAFKTGDWCQGCVHNLNCALANRPVTLHEAIASRAPCVVKQGAIRFYYHGSCCLTFDRVTKCLTDDSYWGYSVTTSRAIRWYVQALVCQDFIPPGKGDQAIGFFKARRKGKDTGSKWFDAA